MEKNKQDLEDRQDPSGAKRIKAKLDEENAKLFGIKKTDVEKLYDWTIFVKEISWEII